MDWICIAISKAPKVLYIIYSHHIRTIGGKLPV